MFQVLLVDDNMYDREGIKKFIDWERFGITSVTTAINGLDGLTKALELSPDVIITDISMPVMNGLEMISEINKQQYPPKYIIMSCHDEFDFAKSAINLSVSNYLLKPINMPELEQALESAVFQLKRERSHKISEIQLREQLNDSLPALKSDLLREIMHTSSNLKNTLKRMAYIDMKLEQKIIVCVMKYDDLDLGLNHTDIGDKYLLSYILKNYFQSLFEPDFTVYSYIIDYSSICCAITGSWETQDGCYDSIMDSLVLLKQNIYEATDFSITIGLSDLIDDISQLPQAFERACLAISAKFFSRGNKIILSSTIEKSITPTEINFIEIEKDMQTIFTTTSDTPTQDFMQKYFSINVHKHEDYIRNLCHIIIFFLQKYLNEHNINFDDIWGANTSIWKKLSAFETIVDIKIWMGNILKICYEFTNMNSNNRRIIIVDQIKQMIQKDFTTIQTVSSVADALFISPGYANVLFKQETDMTIGDYLFETRMDVAKQLLHDPHCKIYEVSDKVGYTSKSYFSAIFKEHTGLSPRDYREKNCK